MHRAKGLFLGVYVDDFHMAGKEGQMKEAWDDLKQQMTFGDITPFHGNTYLGNTQQDIEIKQEFIDERSELWGELLKEEKTKTAQDFEPTPLKIKPISKKKQKIQAKAKSKPRGRTSEPRQDMGDYSTTPIAAATFKKKVRAWQYKMKGAAQGCVERYFELSGLKESSLKPVATPNIEDHLLAPEDFETKGILATCCSKAVLKCLYMVRLARPELYWAVNALAREVTKWNIACDKRLHRLISYIHWKGETCIISYIGDKPSDCNLFLFCDASFAGDLRDSRSTSGSLLCIVGPNTFCPIN